MYLYNIGISPIIYYNVARNNNNNNTFDDTSPLISLRFLHGRYINCNVYIHNARTRYLIPTRSSLFYFIFF
jgi:hypothetical protein